MDYFNQTFNEITADNFIITVDDDLITADMVSLPYVLKFIPRVYEEPTLLKIHDELKNEQYLITPTGFTISDFITLTFDFDFRKLASYQLEVFSGENLIYRSKAKSI
jgi:hypothetical protein